jgi:uncharacterized Zn finger protein
MVSQFKNSQLYVELRPRCPKCKKEFLLDLKRFMPGGFHSCYACGSVTKFDGVLSEKVQVLINDLEATVRQVLDSLSAASR